MPRSGLSRRFHELKRTSSDRVTPARLVQLAHTYDVSLPALAGHLEDLGLIPAGTWLRLRERNFQSRLAARMLGVEQPGQGQRRAALHYRLLAAQLYADGEITETQFAHYLHTDIVGARRAYAELTETADVASDGSLEILDLSGGGWVKPCSIPHYSSTHASRSTSWQPTLSIRSLAASASAARSLDRRRPRSAILGTRPMARPGLLPSTSPITSRLAPLRSSTLHPTKSRSSSNSPAWSMTEKHRQSRSLSSAAYLLQLTIVRPDAYAPSAA